MVEASDKGQVRRLLAGSILAYISAGLEAE